jgi:hypothetical protein
LNDEIPRRYRWPARARDGVDKILLAASWKDGDIPALLEGSVEVGRRLAPFFGGKLARADDVSN